MIGYVGAAATKSIVLGLVILATAAFFVPIQIVHPFWMATFLVLIAVTFCLFGFIIGIWGQNFEQIQFIPMLIVTPLTFLGGAFYSLDMLARAVADDHPFQPGRLSDQRLPLELLRHRRRRRRHQPRRDRGLPAALPRHHRVDVPDRLPAEDLIARRQRDRRQRPFAGFLVGAGDAVAVEILRDELPVDDVAEHASRRIWGARCDSRYNKHAPRHRA